MDIGSEFSSSDWPLHCTIAGVFALDFTDDVCQELSELVRARKPFQSSTTEVAWFGPEKTVKVRLVEMTDELYELHDNIVTFIYEHGGEFNEPLFLRDKFAPHVTMRGDVPRSGEVVSFSQLALIDMFPDADHTRRRVIALMPLVANQG